MCGFAGFLVTREGRRPDQIATTVRHMADAVRHRGPDDAGDWVDEAAGIALGFRRLSIVDLSPLGHQPMVSSTGRYVIAFNGEIYNFPELRQELSQRGSTFAGHSDTEVILSAFERWGVQPAVEQFNGMFAIALWDTHEQELWLCRDRVGKKPLYFGWFDGNLLFGSELKALQRHPSFSPRISAEGLSLYMKKGYVPGTLSIFEGVSKVPAGALLKFPSPISAATAFQKTSYFQLSDIVAEGRSNPLTGGEDVVLDELERQLQGAVNRRMVADVPLGAFLSGGIDSSLIVSLMQRKSDRPVKTFTIGFHEEQFDEAAHARRVAQWLGTDHTELYVSAAEALSVVPLLPTIYDEPFADSSQIPTYLVSSLARTAVTVALSGDGGDELFGGYNRHVWADGRRPLARSVPRPLARLCAAAISATSTATFDRLYDIAAPFITSHRKVASFGEKVHKFGRTLAAGSADDLYNSIVDYWETQVLSEPMRRTVISTTEPAPEFLSLAELMMYRDFREYLADDILVKVDRASMAVSLEARAPFLDIEVIRTAWRVPLELKIRGSQGKWILRQLLDRHVPRHLIERPKVGFGIPLSEWLRGPLRSWAEELLDARKMEAEGNLDPVLVHHRWNELLKGRGNWQHHLWIVLMFQAWLRNLSSHPEVLCRK